MISSIDHFPASGLATSVAASSVSHLVEQRTTPFVERLKPLVQPHAHTLMSRFLDGVLEGQAMSGGNNILTLDETAGVLPRRDVREDDIVL